MMENVEFINAVQEDMEVMVYIIRTIFMGLFTEYIIYKSNQNVIIPKRNILIFSLLTVIVAILSSILKYKIDYLSSILFLILFLGGLNTIFYKENLVKNIVNISISLGINYIIYFITIIIGFIPNILIKLQNDYINIATMLVIHSIILNRMFKIKRFNKGFSFLRVSDNNDYFNILILNIGITIIFAFIISKNSTNAMTANVVIVLAILSIIIYMTIKTILTMYYKHKLLVADLEETKAELANKEKEIEELEKENLEISKTSHTISHKIKSLEFKINDLKMGKELADEIDLSDRIKEISKEYYRKNTAIKLDKTDIEEIDDMLKYMQSRCINNDIEFELQLNGSIHYMVNNVIPKEDLETLLADHIKDAIIAVNHSSNINKSILVRLGLIDGVYSVYIYDSGIEFEEKTLLKIGKEPITTHKDEGGTGMGFMNTFDTLKKYKASMIINEIGKPDKDNYTKSIIIKFDNKNEFKINSYRKIAITQ